MKKDMLIRTLPNRILEHNQSKYLYFSGTSYLGISTHPEFRKLVQEGLELYGMNMGSSRLSNIQLDIFEKAEAHIQTWTGAPAVLTLSSGMLAGQLVARIFQDTTRLYAPLTHPATCFRLEEIPKMSYSNWCQQTLDYIHNSDEEEIMIISNSVDPLTTTQYKFDWLHQTPNNKKLVLLLDDSHGFGVLGQNGAGAYTMQNLPKHVELIVISSMGKALGIPAGVILANQNRIDAIKYSPFFGGASPSIPAYLHAFIKAEHLYNRLRQKLHTNIKAFSTLKDINQHFNFIEQFPVFHTKHNSLTSHLQKHNIIISSFAYPSPKDPCITRVILNGQHTLEDIEDLKQCVQDFFYNHVD